LFKLLAEYLSKTIRTLRNFAFVRICELQQLWLSWCFSGVAPSAIRNLFEKGLRFLVWRRALSQLFLGLMPEFVFPPFGLSGLLPKFMGTNPYLFFRRLCHLSAFSFERGRFCEDELSSMAAQIIVPLSQCEPVQLVPGFCREPNSPRR